MDRYCFCTWDQIESTVRIYGAPNMSWYSFRHKKKKTKNLELSPCPVV